MPMHASCSHAAASSALHALKPLEISALQWMFSKYAASDGKRQTLTVNGTLALLHFVRWSWQKGRLDRKISTLLQTCDVNQGLEGRFGPDVLAWLLRSLGRVHIERVALLHTAEKVLHDRMWDAATRAGRKPAICHAASAALGSVAPVAILPVAHKQPWRYFSAFRCSGHGRSSCYGWRTNSPEELAKYYRARGDEEAAKRALAAGPACAAENSTQVCMTFKPSVYGRELRGLRLHGGRTFVDGSEGPLLAFDWDGEQLMHNLAILQQPNDEWIALGGLEGFVSNRTCRFGSGPTHRSRERCLQLSEPVELLANQSARRTKAKGGGGRRAAADASGIRLLRGVGWRYDRSRWSEPRIVVRGNDPKGCVDRRPPFTGWPTLEACEFDGRLSLVNVAAGCFRLYARANVGYGLVAGGRSVQTTKSCAPDLRRGSWERWQPIRLAGVNVTELDLYFFAVQDNPSDKATLLALMPVSEPPWACIAIAFSRDGVSWSRPVNLRDSRVAFKKHESYAQHDALSGGFSVRAEDHPVANIVHDPAVEDGYLVYIHHHVKGVSYRPVHSHVAGYSVDGPLLRRLTAEGLASL